jgi:hypothetical protein
MLASSSQGKSNRLTTTRRALVALIEVEYAETAFSYHPDCARDLVYVNVSEQIKNALPDPDRGTAIHNLESAIAELAALRATYDSLTDDERGALPSSLRAFFAPIGNTRLVSDDGHEYRPARDDE